jgi:hypothetical protein
MRARWREKNKLAAQKSRCEFGYEHLHPEIRSASAKSFASLSLQMDSLHKKACAADHKMDATAFFGGAPPEIATRQGFSRARRTKMCARCL